MGDETTLSYEISQGIFEFLWKMSLSKINKDGLKADFKATGPELTVNAINKACDKRFDKALLSLGEGLGGLTLAATLAVGWEHFMVPAVWAILDVPLMGASAVAALEALKLNAYIKAGKEYLKENNEDEALQRVLDHEKENSLKEINKRLFKSLFKKRNS